MSYSSIPWLLLATVLTALGLVLSYAAYRRSGVRPALRGTAVSLLPVAAYLTGAIEMFWKIGVAIGQFGTGFVFSTTKWAGIGLTGLAIALFLAAGGRARRKASREARKEARAQRQEADLDASRPGHGASSAPGALGAPARTGTDVTRAMTPTRERVPVAREATPKASKPSRKAQPADDDMSDIEDILRKRGI